MFFQLCISVAIILIGFSLAAFFRYLKKNIGSLTIYTPDCLCKSVYALIRNITNRAIHLTS